MSLCQATFNFWAGSTQINIPACADAVNGLAARGNNAHAIFGNQMNRSSYQIGLPSLAGDVGSCLIGL